MHENGLKFKVCINGLLLFHTDILVVRNFFAIPDPVLNHLIVQMINHRSINFDLESPPRRHVS